MATPEIKYVLLPSTDPLLPRPPTGAVALVYPGREMLLKELLVNDSVITKSLVPEKLLMDTLIVYERIADSPESDIGLVIVLKVEPKSELALDGKTPL